MKRAGATEAGTPLAAYRAPLATFAGIWLAAVGLLAARGEWSWVGRAGGTAAALALFIALTFWLTRGRPEPNHGNDASDGRSTETPRKLALQLGVVLILAVLAALRSRGIPGWSGFIELLYDAGAALPVPHANYLANPVLYVVLPGAAVLALGATWRGIGFRPGWRPWRVIAAWSAPVVGVWIYGMVTAGLAPGRIVRALVSHTFQNGFMEEFLWRGVVQTRIARLWSPAWGLVVASLLFGWWHMDAITDWSGDDWWMAAAMTTVVQAPFGLAMGVIFDRTRNLLAPSVVHAVANTVDV